jgi:hypothetical protein
VLRIYYKCYETENSYLEWTQNIPFSRKLRAGVGHDIRTIHLIMGCQTQQWRSGNIRRRVYAEITKPSRVELKCNFSDTREGFGIST